jgi:hypothetical protein
MEYSINREAIGYTVTQEIPSILWEPKVYHRIHKILSPASILIQINAIHIAPSYLSKIRLNIIHLSTSWSS